MRTREKLAAELRKVAAIASKPNAAKYEAFAIRALTGEFDDYADTYVCPITQLHSELTAAGRRRPHWFDGGSGQIRTDGTLRPPAERPVGRFDVSIVLSMRALCTPVGLCKHILALSVDKPILQAAEKGCLHGKG